MKCDNIHKLNEIKGEFEKRLNRINYLIKHGNRNKITFTMIRDSQKIREYLEKDINICNSLLNNNSICSMDIRQYVDISEFHITNIDEFLKTAERFIH